jgi:predicted aspartyl protease
LPSKYIVASIPSANSLEVDVQIQGTDIGAPISLSTLLDCGATGIFMDTEWARKNKIITRPLSRPIPVYNVDGSPNAAGEIKDIAEVTLRYKDHTELAHFAITQLGKQNIILGYSWLRQHNPEVDWVAKEVNMS